jgi:hypothetical protein
MKRWLRLKMCECCGALVRPGRLCLLFVVSLLAIHVTGCAPREPLPREWQADLPYSFTNAPYISPMILADLTAWLSDTDDQVVAIDLLGAQDSNRYFGDIHVRETDSPNPFVYVEKDGGEFGYCYVGVTESGVHIVQTSDWGGGSGVFKSLLLLTIEPDTGLTLDVGKRPVLVSKRRLLIKKLGDMSLGDRWDGDLSVSGNRLRVGADKGWFSGGPDGRPSDRDLKDTVLEIEINHSVEYLRDQD